MARRDAGASGASGGAEAELTVFAASSLTEAFSEIGDEFEAANPGTTVTFNFGPSGRARGARSTRAPRRRLRLRERDLDGRGAGRRAGRDRSRGLRAEPARDHHAARQPGGIEDLEDLADDGVQLVLAAEGVPVGDYAREIFENAGITEAASRTSSPTRRT